MKKKILAVLTWCVLAFGITGCNIPKFKTVNPIYKDAQNTVQFLVDAIERKNAKAIKDKFSSYAKDRISNFDEKIDRFIDEFPGWNEDYELSDTSERWSNHGKITNMLTPSYDFVVNSKKYRMRIIYYKESDEDESKLGWYSLQIMDLSTDSYSSGVYMHGVDDEPDILLWDYTKY